MRAECCAGTSPTRVKRRRRKSGKRRRAEKEEAGEKKDRRLIRSRRGKVRSENIEPEFRSKRGTTATGMSTFIRVEVFGSG